MRDMVVLINLDSGVCRSMARKLRAEHIYCKILPAQSTARDVLSQDALGILLAGASTGDKADIPHLQELLDCGLPVLGMGDAALTLCEALGGALGEKAREPGVVQVRFEGDDPLVAQVESGERYLPALRCMIFGDDAALTREIQGLADKYQQITGQEMEKYFRPPQGIFNEQALKRCRLWAIGRYSGAWPMWTGTTMPSQPGRKRWKSSCPERTTAP